MNKAFSLKKILVIQTAFLGDVVLITAVLENLYDSFPGAEMDIVIKKNCEKVLENHPYINKIYIWDKKKKYPSFFKLLWKIRKKKYDIVFNFHRYFSTGLITLFSKASIKVGFSQNPLSCFYTIKKKKSSKKEHQIVKNFSLLKPFTEKKYRLPKLYPTNLHFENVKKLQKNQYITIHPASAWQTKQLPIGIWLAFLNRLPRDIMVYILANEKEREICDTISQRTNHENCKVLTKELHLLEVAVLMQNALLNYSNDSAPLHICSAMQANVCAIFCSTTPQQGFQPLSKKSFIVETSIPLSCRPCGSHGYKKCPQYHFYCGITITAQQLLNNFKKMYNFTKK